MKALAIAASLLVSLVLSASAVAVDNGVPDGHRHPNVGMLGFDFDAEGGSPPYFLCTGSVLSDRAFLTAAHCIDVFDDTVQWVASLEPGHPSEPAYMPGFVFDDFPFEITADVERPVATIVHPGFDPETLEHDLAVLVFAPGTFDVRPIELPRPRLLDAHARQGQLETASFTLVGYGADPDHSTQPPRYFARGYRQTASAAFLAIDSRQLQLVGAGGRGGLCLGDSGSPQLLPGTRIAVSQLSAVGDTCQEIIAQRLDVPADRGFLARYANGSRSARTSSSP